MINITSSELNNYKILNQNKNSSIYFAEEGYLYKIFEEENLKNRVRNIKFLMGLNIPNILLPIDLIEIDGQIRGYKMKYLKDFKTFKDSLADNNLRIKDKTEIIKSIFQAIRRLHKLGVFLEDIQLENFMYFQNEGIVIDLDDIHFSFEEDNTRAKYYLKGVKNKNPFYLDNLKVVISSFSLLMGINIEELIKDNDLNAVLNSLNLPEEVLLYIQTIIDSEEIIYFDEIVEYIAPLIPNNTRK